MSRKIRILGLVVFICLALSMVFVQAPTKCYGDELIIQVAPSTLNIQSSGTWVAVHTDIPYSIVLGTSVELNGIPIAWSKADDQGYFVAKFAMSDVKDLYTQGGLALGENLVTLYVLTIDEQEFVGTTTITVIDVSGK